MPDARPLLLSFAALTILAGALPAQQPDSVARRDSIQADSIRRAELARIRSERRVVDDTAERSTTAAVSGARQPTRGTLTLSLTGEALADLSPEAAARAPGSRLRAGDMRVALGAVPSRHVRADLSITFRNDSAPQITTAAITAELRGPELLLRAGRMPVPFGIAAPRQRVDLWFPDHPLPVRAFLGQRGIRASGAMIAASRTLAGAPLTLRLGVFDRFGEKIDSLQTPEPADQEVTGLSGFARLSTEWTVLGARVTLGASSISGKREQPIGCLYQGTIGPVPCPNGISGANTRMTVIGGDALITRGRVSLEGEILRNIVGATDMPVFDLPGFAPYYSGMYGTYDGGYVQLRFDGPGTMRFGARAEAAQNPAVGGLNDGAAGAFVGIEPVPGGRIVLSYLRRVPSTATKTQLSAEERVALDRIVLRGTFALSWLLQRDDQ